MDTPEGRENFRLAIQHLDSDLKALCSGALSLLEKSRENDACNSEDPKILAAGWMLSVCQIPGPSIEKLNLQLVEGIGSTGASTGASAATPGFTTPEAALLNGVADFVTTRAKEELISFLVADYAKKICGRLLGSLPVRDAFPRTCDILLGDGGEKDPALIDVSRISAMFQGALRDDLKDLPPLMLQTLLAKTSEETKDEFGEFAPLLLHLITQHRKGVPLSTASDRIILNLKCGDPNAPWDSLACNSFLLNAQIKYLLDPNGPLGNANHSSIDIPKDSKSYLEKITPLRRWSDFKKAKIHANQDISSISGWADAQFVDRDPHWCAAALLVAAGSAPTAPTTVSGKLRDLALGIDRASEICTQELPTCECGQLTTGCKSDQDLSCNAKVSQCKADPASAKCRDASNNCHQCTVKETICKGRTPSTRCEEALGRFREIKTIASTWMGLAEMTYRSIEAVKRGEDALLVSSKAMKEFDCGYDPNDTSAKWDGERDLACSIRLAGVITGAIATTQPSWRSVDFKKPDQIEVYSASLRGSIKTELGRPEESGLSQWIKNKYNLEISSDEPNDDYQNLITRAKRLLPEIREIRNAMEAAQDPNMRSTEERKEAAHRVIRAVVTFWRDGLEQGTPSDLEGRATRIVDEIADVWEAAEDRKYAAMLTSLSSVVSDLGLHLPLPDEVQQGLPLITALAGAETAGDVSAALEKYAAPLGTWRDKQRRVNGIWFTAFAGGTVGREFVSGSAGAELAAFVPIGVDFVKGPYGLFASILDVGTLASLRIQGTKPNMKNAPANSATDTADTKLKHVFSPGLYWRRSIRNTPFVYGLGGSWVPGLRDGMQKSMPNLNVYRINAFLSIDVSIVAIHRGRLRAQVNQDSKAGGSTPEHSTQPATSVSDGPVSP